MEERRLISTLREILDDFQSVRLAYLYGSYSRGDQGPMSDLDIAILTDRRSEIPEIAARSSRALGISEDKISILDLRLVDDFMKMEIASRGVKLIDRGVEFNEMIPESAELVEVFELEHSSSNISWIREILSIQPS